MAGPISAAALAATSVTLAGKPKRRHCPESEYYLPLSVTRKSTLGYRNQKIRYFRVFKAAWPKMADWFAAPLAERVRLPGQTQKKASYPASFQARPYLVFLGLRGCLTLDYAWMFGAGRIRIDDAPRRSASTWAPAS